MVNKEEKDEVSILNRLLLLEDVNVPLLSGVDLLTALREADDYVKKPFDPEELLIRIKAKTASLKERLTVKEFEIDLQSQEIFYKKQPLYLGNVLKNILFSLIQNYPNPVTRLARQ